MANSLRLVASHATVSLAAREEGLHRASPYARGSVTEPGRGIRTAQIVHVHGPFTRSPTPSFRMASSSRADFGYRTVLAARRSCAKGVPIGGSGHFDGRRSCLHRQADRPPQDLCRPGGHRDQNVRLFTSWKHDARPHPSVGELRALGEVSQAVGSTLDLETVLATIVSRAVQLSGTRRGIVYEFDEATRVFHVRATHRLRRSTWRCCARHRSGSARGRLVGPG